MNAREYLDRAEWLLQAAEESVPGSEFHCQTMAALSAANSMLAALLLVVAVVEGRER